ncbi:MAG TPA: hypothetical protein VF168_07975 [Trueperaceae bacterium]
MEQRGNLSMFQRFGLPLMVLLPLLALFGVFGVTFERTGASSERLELHVRHSTRTRLRAPHLLTVEVTNRGQSPLEGVTVVVDREYVDAFSNVAFTPQASEVTPDEYRIELGTIAASATRLVTADMTPAAYWRHEGIISASAEGVEPVEVAVATFVFP